MLPQSIFSRLSLDQLADYIAALDAEAHRARARLALQRASDEYVANRRAERAAESADKQKSQLATAVKMARSGAKNADIAARLDVSTRTVARILHNAWRVD